MKVSVVIPTFNRRRSLERCLTALEKQSVHVRDFEVVVVSDGSTDDTVAFLHGHNTPFAFRWFQQENKGPAAAQNFGIAMASGDLVIFLDDDCICEPGVIAAHMEAHAHGERIVGLGSTRLHPDSPPGTLNRLKHKLAQSDLQHLSSEGATAKDLMLCANTSIARSAALATPFDTSFERMHDVEAGRRLHAQGFVPRFVSGAVAHEIYTKTVAGALRDAYYHGKYESVLTSRWPEYKPLSGIGIINNGNPIKRALRRSLALHPRLSEYFLRSIYAIAESLQTIPMFATVAARTLQARMAIQHLAGAIEQAGSWQAIEDKFGKRVPVLIYHNVGAPKPGEYLGLTTPTAEFRKQIQFLSRLGYHAITPSEWLRWREAGGALPKRPVMLVFDDGYQEAAEQAFPILGKYGFAAGCTVVTGCVGSTNRWDEEAGRPSFPLMSAEQIRAWAGRGIEFGGHTQSHPYLPESSPEVVESEIRACADDLVALLGLPAQSFAYPFGGVSEEAVANVGRHFAIAFTVWPGILHLGSNPYLVPRIAFLPGETHFGMWCRLRLGKNPFEVVRNRWRRFLGRHPEAPGYQVKSQKS